MKRHARLTFICIFILSCSSTQECLEGMNLLPMFGGKSKCKEQLESDRQFLTESDTKFKNRRQACQFYIDNGWTYFYKNDLETSMKRFNQAWLLDSLNADVYWGFGNILGTKHEFESSIPFLEKSIKLNPNNPKVYQSIASSFGQMFFQSKNIDLLNKTIENLKNVVRLEPQNAVAYGQLTAAYSYFYQSDSANKYLKLTDKLDPKAVSLEVRKMLREK